MQDLNEDLLQNHIGCHSGPIKTCPSESVCEFEEARFPKIISLLIFSPSPCSDRGNDKTNMDCVKCQVIFWKKKNNIFLYAYMF